MSTAFDVQRAFDSRVLGALERLRISPDVIDGQMEQRHFGPGGNTGSGYTPAINVSSPLQKTGTTTITIGFISQSANVVLAGPTSGGAAAPAFRALVNNDLPVVDAAHGGTGQSSYTIGDILYASGTTALSKLAGVATGNALISGGVGVAPSWGKVGLTTHVSGTLPATSGGTGLTVYAVGDILYADTTTTLARLADIATGNALISGGVSTAPSWGKIALTTHISGTLPVANGGTNITSYAVGDLIYASGATTLSKLAGVATGNALISGGVGVAPSWGKVDVTAHISGVVPVASGGTNISSYTVGDILYASGATTLSKLADVATGNALISGGVGVAPGWGKIALTTHISGTLPIASGGTNSTAALNNNRIMVSSGGGIVEAGAMTDGQLLIGDTSAAPVVATLTQGAGITITNGAGSITIAVAAGAAPHTIQEEGVNLTARTGLNFIGAALTAADDAGNDRTNVTLSQSPASSSVVGTGRTITVSSPLQGSGDLSADRTISFANQAANTVLSGPASGADAAPTFRALGGTDLPWVGSANTIAYWSGANTLTFDADLTYNGTSMGLANGSLTISGTHTGTPLSVSQSTSNTVAVSFTPVITSSNTGTHIGLNVETTHEPAGATLAALFGTTIISNLEDSTTAVATWVNAFLRNDLNATFTGTLTTMENLRLTAPSTGGTAPTNFYQMRIVQSAAGTNNTSLLLSSGTPTGSYAVYSDSTRDSYMTGQLGLGVATAPAALIHANLSNATTNVIDTVAIIEHTSTGTAAASFGSRLLYRLESSTTVAQEAAGLEAFWTTATHASRTAAMSFSTVNNAGSLTERMRLTGPGALWLGTTSGSLTGAGDLVVNGATQVVGSTTAGWFAVGTTVDTSQLITTAQTFTANGQYYAANLGVTMTSASSHGTWITGVKGSPVLNPNGFDASNDHAIRGGWFAPSTGTGAGTVTGMVGVYTLLVHGSSGVLTNAYGAYLGSVSISGAGSVTNSYGLYIANQDSGTNDWAIYTNAGQVHFGDHTDWADAKNLAFGTGTGTKIGTATSQKIGLWNATPVIQQVLTSTAAYTVTNLTTDRAYDANATTLDELADFVGTLAGDFADLRTKIRNTGLLA